MVVICETPFEITTALDFFAESDLNLVHKIVVTSQFSIKESPEILYNNCVDLLLVRSNKLDLPLFNNADEHKIFCYICYTNSKILKFQVIVGLLCSRFNILTFLNF
jgi:hypothetical protein